MSTPDEERPDATSVLLPGPWTHRDLSANGVRLHVAEAGEGPLVLLLHGFPEFWWAWRAQLPVLAAAGFRAVAPDLRGYGASERRGPYDVRTLAADVRELVLALGRPRAASPPRSRCGPCRRGSGTPGVPSRSVRPVRGRPIVAAPSARRFT